MKEGRVVRLTEKDLNSGDHIFVRRKRLLYSHHGIYAGEGTVIHYKGTAKEKKDPLVMVTDMDNFLNNGKLKRRKYKNRLSPSETLKLAREHLSKKGYSLAFNNCEHFATYCVTGKKRSRQVRSVVGSMLGITLTIAAGVFQKKRARK
jgi:cell wall-associated NlpC family hydrolase